MDVAVTNAATRAKPVDWGWRNLTPEQRALTEEHAGLAYYLADRIYRGLANVVIDREDLRQESLIGLCKAAHRWNPSHEAEASFPTYAQHIVDGHLRDHLRDLDHLTRFHRRKIRERGSEIAADKVAVSYQRIAETGGYGNLDALLPATNEPGYTEVEDATADAQAVHGFLAYAATQPWFRGHMPYVAHRYLAGARLWQIAEEVGISEGRASQIWKDLTTRAVQWGRDNVVTTREDPDPECATAPPSPAPARPATATPHPSPRPASTAGGAASPAAKPGVSPTPPVTPPAPPTTTPPESTPPPVPAHKALAPRWPVLSPEEVARLSEVGVPAFIRDRDRPVPYHQPAPPMEVLLTTLVPGRTAGKWRRTANGVGPLIADNSLDILDTARVVARIDRIKGGYRLSVYMPSRTLHEPIAVVTDSRSTYLRKIGTALLQETGTTASAHEAYAAVVRHTTDLPTEG